MKEVRVNDLVIQFDWLQRQQGVVLKNTAGKPFDWFIQVTNTVAPHLVPVFWLRHIIHMHASIGIGIQRADQFWKMLTTYNYKLIPNVVSN